MLWPTPPQPPIYVFILYIGDVILDDRLDVQTWNVSLCHHQKDEKRTRWVLALRERRQLFGGGRAFRSLRSNKQLSSTMFRASTCGRGFARRVHERELTNKCAISCGNLSASDIFLFWWRLILRGVLTEHIYSSIHTVHRGNPNSAKCYAQRPCNDFTDLNEVKNLLEKNKKTPKNYMYLWQQLQSKAS